MHKGTPGVHRSLRNIAEQQNGAAGFDGPSDATYDAMGGTPKAAKDVSHGTYDCNVQGTLVQTPIPSKSIKNPVK